MLDSKSSNFVSKFRNAVIVVSLALEQSWQWNPFTRDTHGNRLSVVCRLFLFSVVSIVKYLGTLSGWANQNGSSSTVCYVYTQCKLV